MEYNKPYEMKYRNAVPSYLENSVVKPFFHTDLKNSLEGISLKVQAEKGSSPLERIFSDRSKTLKAGVKALLSEIELRENLNKYLINGIDDDFCKQHAYLEHLKKLPVHYSFELAKSLSKTKMQIENSLIDLEKEKRKEQLECWRDLMFLKKYLMISLKDYWELVKKQGALSYDLNENETERS